MSLNVQTWMCLGIYLVVVAGAVWGAGRVLVGVRPGLYLAVEDAMAVITKAFIFQG